MLDSPANLEKAIERAKGFQIFIATEAKLRGLTTTETALALQGAELILQETHGEAWTIAWGLASRVWARARAMRK